MAEKEIKAAVDTSDGSSSAATLKKKLQKLVTSIVEQDEFKLENANEAIRVLMSLKELRKAKRPLVSKELTFPAEFICPMTQEIMRDPVILMTGRTYERRFIERWLKEGSRICPLSKQVLSDITLTPNLLMRGIISHWCREHKLELDLHPLDETVFSTAGREHLEYLLEKMKSKANSVHQKTAANELRRLTKNASSYRALFREVSDGLSGMLTALNSEPDPDLEEDLVATLLNLSLQEKNKKLIADDPKAIPLLNSALNSSSVESRRNAAATLFSLSSVKENRYLIGESGTMKQLVKLLEDENKSVIRDAAATIFNLCVAFENKKKAIQEGAVGAILRSLRQRLLVEEMIALLATLSKCSKGVVEMAELGAASSLLEVMKNGLSDQSMENALVVLYAICWFVKNARDEVKNVEDTTGLIQKMAKIGSDRARRKADGILEWFGRLEPEST